MCKYSHTHTCACISIKQTKEKIFTYFMQCKLVDASCTKAQNMQSSVTVSTHFINTNAVPAFLIPSHRPTPRPSNIAPTFTHNPSSRPISAPFGIREGRQERASEPSAVLSVRGPRRPERYTALARVWRHLHQRHNWVVPLGCVYRRFLSISEALTAIRGHQIEIDGERRAPVIAGT